MIGAVFDIEPLTLAEFLVNLSDLGEQADLLTHFGVLDEIFNRDLACDILERSDS